MYDEQSQSAQYCSDLVRTRDEDRWLAAQYAPRGDRRRLLTLYALHCELRHIPAAVSEPPLGEMRLQWWRDALEEIRTGAKPRAHPVVEEIAFAGLADAGFTDDLNEAIHAAARPLYGERFPDIELLVSWLKRADGSVDKLAARLLGAGDEVIDAASGAGAAFALAREGLRLAPELKTDIARSVEALWLECAPRLQHAPASVVPAVLHLALTRIYLNRGAKPFPALKRLRLFAAMALGRI